MKLYNEYSYAKINEYAQKNGFTEEFHGAFQIGEQFLILRADNNADQVLSFVLTGTGTSQSMYKLIYTDL